MNWALFEIELPLLHSAVGRRSVSTLVFSHLFQAYGWNYYAEFALQLFTFSPATQKFVSINLALCPIGPSTTLANNPLQNPDYALAHDESIKVLCLI